MVMYVCKSGQAACRVKLSFCVVNVLHKFNFIILQCTLAYCSIIIIIITVHVYRSVEIQRDTIPYLRIYMLHVYTYIYVMYARTVVGKIKFT